MVVACGQRKEVLKCHVKHNEILSFRRDVSKGISE